ncbi:hypothetical protein L596_026019 [Steinernema carpocapsae]|uniref:G-protein coupled receptors family 1 profile domain-containing protein n=1 Tax=Steinernema carpocapsae TaxID=34508 RepID=A0A4U5M024_STECR|nr:hypothetical protein L596_026019 [Steinernema carpocapsae]
MVPMRPVPGLMSDSILATFLQCLEIALFLCGFITQSYFLIRMRRIGLLHFNLKVLLSSFSLAYVIVALTRLLNYAEDWIAKDSNTLTVLQGQRCFIRRLFYDTAINVVSIAMASFAFERLLATVYSHKYEQIDGRRAGILVGVLVWLISFAGALFMFLENLARFDFWHKPIPFDTCDILKTFPKALQLIAIIAAICYVFTAVSFITVHIHNRRISNQIATSSASHSLSLRYQHAENISTTRFLSVIVATFGVDLFCSCFSLFYVTLNSSKEPDLLVEILSVAYNIVDASYSFLFPLMCILLHRPLQDQLKKDLKRVICWNRWRNQEAQKNEVHVRTVSGKTIPLRENSKTYFESLQQMWN